MLKGFDIIAWLIYCAVIYWLSDQPTLPVPMVFEFQDKFHHFSAYFIMAVLAWRAFRHSSADPFVPLMSAVVFCSLFGVSDEWHQSFVEGRTADAWDWVADTFGALAAGWMLTVLHRYGKIKS